MNKKMMDYHEMLGTIRKYSTPILIGAALVGAYLGYKTLSFIIGTVRDSFSVLLTIVAGGLGYFIMQFIMAPVQRYLEIRHQVTSDLLYYANAIGAKGAGEALRRKQDERQESNRKHASEIVAAYYRLPGFYRFWLKRKGEDPLDASRGLIGLSTSFDYEQAYPYLKQLLKSLNLHDIDI